MVEPLTKFEQFTKLCRDVEQAKIVARMVFWSSISWNVVNVIKKLLDMMGNNADINFIQTYDAQRIDDKLVNRICLKEADILVPFTSVKANICQTTNIFVNLHICLLINKDICQLTNIFIEIETKC